ncbi:hypothetical protein LJB42_001011 [Komagataella kurtzmanii]|nr:hypothetical protein LJB42_001011 [Komagataella kurtzmanii]
MSMLKPFLEKPVRVITSDGKLITGILLGFDVSTNIILEKAQERVFHLTEETQTIDLGLFLLRGNNVVCIGLVDEEEEETMNWASLHGRQLGDTWHALD